MSRRTSRVSRGNVGRTYKIIIGIIVGAYILLYALSLFNPDKTDNTITQKNKVYQLGDYEIYLLDKEYNPKSQLLLTKYYLKQKDDSSNYIPLTEKNFEVETKLQEDLTIKQKNKVMMPNKNYLIIATRGLPDNQGMMKLDLKMKSDVVSVDDENVISAKTSFYFDTDQKIQNKHLVIQDVEAYKEEGREYQVSFLNKDIESLKASIEKLDQENVNAYEQIDVVKEQAKELTGEQKQSALLKIDDYKSTITANVSEINNIKKKIEIKKTEINKINMDLTA